LAWTADEAAIGRVCPTEAVFGSLTWGLLTRRNGRLILAVEVADAAAKPSHNLMPPIPGSVDRTLPQRSSASAHSAFPALNPLRSANE
jgi:hypothetical protein